MKKLALISCLVLGACAQLGIGSTGDANAVPATTQAKLKACILEQAAAKVQDGSAFTAGLQATASAISSDCLKKLALESVGLDTQATSEATNALSSLMSLAKQ